MIAVASFTATFTTIAVYLWWRAHGRDDYEDIEAACNSLGRVGSVGGNFGGFLMRELQQEVIFFWRGSVFFFWGGRGN